MSTTLYRKYRPANFSELIGQKHVVQTLKNAIKSGRIGQAYLFAGPRGTGKTSIARIFAKTINCTSLKNGEPCLKCDSCKNILDNRSLDIIEIDAASNTGVDNIRELRETVKLPPSSLKYKVYIIDEVHMLSGGAFNALLKTLEEPPANVIFILATTEVHKIPETILSRVQRFDFTRLTIEEIIKRLEEIAKLEKVKVDREALEIIASSSEGGMRNAESLLGQVIALEDKKITTKEVEFILGTVSEKFTAEFVDLIINKKYPEVFAKIGELREMGIDFKNFGKSLLNYLRQMLVLKINPDLGQKLSYEITKERLEQIKKQVTDVETSEILDFINILQENSEKFKSSPIPQLFLEVSIARLAARLDTPTSPQRGSTSSVKTSETKSENTSVKRELSSKSVEERGRTSTNMPETAQSIAGSKTKNSNSADIDLVLSNWAEIIDSLKSYNHSLSSVLKMSQPVLIDENFLVLKTKYDFYKDKLVEMTNRLTIEKAIDKITGVDLKLKPITEKELTEDYPNFKEKKSLLQEAADIFGGKIV
ncbi:MAG TPA: DNA polymerase III subunit gamma/tau [Candidatus Bathyarchaeia archaeon]|nr:DNA polymerase III subunit gamma/tau [Candidatus Bathyarchaeia archaeon]